MLKSALGKSAVECWYKLKLTLQFVKIDSVEQNRTKTNCQCCLVFMAANFKHNSTENLEKLLKLQPDRPILVSEYWPGWFDRWFEPIHNTQPLSGSRQYWMKYLLMCFDATLSPLFNESSYLTLRKLTLRHN